jgi:hypothetical protein
MSPAAATAAAGTGLVLSSAGFLSSYYDMAKNGANACNRFGLAMSLVGVMFGGLGTPPSAGPAFAVINGDVYASTAQIAGSISQLLSGLGGISLVSMMSGGSEQSGGGGSDGPDTSSTPEDLPELLVELSKQTDIKNENCNSFVNRYLARIGKPTLPDMDPAAEAYYGYAEYANALKNNFTKISDLSQARPGDLVSWYSKVGNGGIYKYYSHIGVYLGDNLYFSKFGYGEGFDTLSIFDPRNGQIMEIWR